MHLRFSSRWALRFLTSVLWLFFLVYGTLWSAARVQQMTAPGTRPHALLRVSRYGYDVGIDTVPARADRDGRIQLWFYGANDDAPTTVIRIPGSPAPASPART